MRQPRLIDRLSTAASHFWVCSWVQGNKAVARESTAHCKSIFKPFRSASPGNPKGKTLISRPVDKRRRAIGVERLQRLVLKLSELDLLQQEPKLLIAYDYQ